MHALKSCRRFHNLNTLERMHVARVYGFCENCLAHTHSQGTCFTKTSCWYCGKAHHSLIHTHSWLEQTTTSQPKMTSSGIRRSRSASPSSSNRGLRLLNSTSTPTSLSAILNRNNDTLLPTILARAKFTRHDVYCTQQLEWVMYLKNNWINWV